MSQSHLLQVLCFSLSLFVITESTELCSRLHLRGMDPRYMSNVQFGGIYRRTDMKWYGFPVLELETSPGVYFYYNEPVQQFFVALDNQTSLGLGATVSANFDVNEDSWISSSNEPLKYILDKWFEYDRVKKANLINYDNTDSIGFVCVEDNTDFLPCHSGNFTFNYNLFWKNPDHSNEFINHVDLNSYKRLPGVYRGLRPVYERLGSPKKAYLYYFNDDRWVIGPDYNKSLTFLYVVDTAMSPEYITNQWFYTQGLFKVPSDLKLRCSGLKVPGTGCNSTLETPVCSNNGICKAKDDDEVFCLCPSGYDGATCEQQLLQCQALLADDLPPNTIDYLAVGISEGTLARFTCAGGFSPKYYYSRCIKDTPSSVSWHHNGSCGLTTVAPSPSTVAPSTLSSALFTTRYYDKVETYGESDSRSEQWGEPAWLEDFVLSMLIIIPIITPFFIWLFSKNLKLSRTYSLFFWLTFWFYFFFMVGCTSTKCGHYSDSLAITAAVAIISMPLLIIVLIAESFMASEGKYIKNLAKSQNISSFLEKLRRSQPVIYWRVECYHYETRYRTVYYTDAQGNSQSRQESYQERVVTHSETKTFDFNYWYDSSAPTVEGIEKYKITRIKLDKEVIPGDSETERVMNDQKEEMQERNRYRDTFMDFCEDQHIPGFEKRLAAYVDKSGKNWWINTPFYWIASLLILSWPYRWLFKWNTGKTFYAIKKKVFFSMPENNDSDVKACCGTQLDEDSLDAAAKRNSNLTNIPVNGMV